MTVSVRTEGDQNAALQYVRAAKAFLERTKQLRDLRGTSTVARTYRADANTYIYALTSGTVDIVMISTAPRVFAPVGGASISGSMYPFLGGVSFDGLIKQGLAPNSGTMTKLLSTFAPTARTQEDLKLSAGAQNTPLLPVEPYYDDLKSKAEAPVYPYSQYTMLKPTMYTGAMKFVVQLVMSYGKQRIKMGPKDASAGHISRVSAVGHQVLFDFHFSRTHGIAFGSDGTPWLVEISVTNGVLITPLPRFEYTMPKRSSNGTLTWPYRAIAEASGRTEVVAFLNLFGGMATGEAFPSDIDGAIAKGTVLRLMKPEDLNDFYRCSGYSSAMGWAFPGPLRLGTTTWASDGNTTVHNTGYYLDEAESGVYIGYHYSIKLNIGAYLPERLKYQNPLPIVDASATLQREGQGYLIQKLPAPLFIKFWEPLLTPAYGGLLSVDVRTPPGKGQQFDATCETPMHVFYIGRDLKVVKWYHDADYTGVEEEITTTPACPDGGGRIYEYSSGISRIDNQFFSNDWDKRKPHPDIYEHTERNSSDLGYAPPYYTDWIQDPQFCDVIRQRVWKHTDIAHRQSGISHYSVVMVPAFMREAYYIAHAEHAASSTTTESRHWVALDDPQAYVGWRKIYEQDFGYAAGCPKGSKQRIVIDAPEPDLSGCKDLAYRGSWLGPCDNVESMTGTSFMKQSESDPAVPTPTTQVEAKLFSCTEIPETSLPVTWEHFSNLWLTRSPDPESGLVQFISVLTNTFGQDSTLYVPDFLTPVVQTGTTVVPRVTDNVTFIGVVS